VWGDTIAYIGCDAATQARDIRLLVDGGFELRGLRAVDDLTPETIVPREQMEELDRLYWKTAKAFPWQNGDIIMLDNMLVAHARKPFTGARKIVVAMGEMVDGASLPS